MYMKVFLLICTIAILLLVSRVYYEKQVEGLENMENAEEPVQNVNPETVQEETTNIEPQPNEETTGTDPANLKPPDGGDFNDFINKIGQIEELTNGVKNQMFETQKNKERFALDEKNKPCDTNTYFINQHFNHYYPQTVETKKDETKDLPINYFLNNIIAKKKSKNKDTENATSIKSKKKSSIPKTKGTGFFTDIGSCKKSNGPPPYNF